MNEMTDCLLIGHNEIPLEQYEKSVGAMGHQSVAYRDLSLNFIMYNNRPYSVSDMFNLLSRSEHSPSVMGNKYKALSSCSVFSAAIAYLGSYLTRRGYTFDYIHSFQEEKDELARKLASNRFRAVGIITTYYVSTIPIIEIMEFIKRHHPNVPIIIGGPFVSTKCRSLEPAALEYLFNNTIGADIYVNSSQGEGALVSILQALKDKTALDDIPNIYFKKEDRYIATPIVRENNELSQNLVDWSLFGEKLGNMVNVRTSISCPFTCAFCGFPERAGKYQVLSVEDIEKELNTLSKIETVKHLKFIDDTFNVPVERFKGILRMMIKNKYRFDWYSNFRCQFADEETVSLLKESRCGAVFLGIESGNNTILKNMNKAATVEKFNEGIRLLKKYEIPAFASFIVGFPGETDETVQDTFHFIKESGVDFYQAQPWYCDPITPIFREKEKYGISGESFEWSHQTMDANEATHWVEKIFLSVQSSIWVPQHDFSIDTFWNLREQGYSPENLKQFLRTYDEGIREKIQNPQRKEISLPLIKQMKKYCTLGEVKEDIRNEKSNLLKKQKVEFNF